MRDKLIQYVNLLFAGAADSEDIRQEILQNTLDRYDDLIDQGKSPEAAYRLAISGIGDVNEILGNPSHTPTPSIDPARGPVRDDAEEKERRKKRAVAIAMYILSPVPLFILGSVGTGVLGLCMMFLLIAAATALIIMSGNDSEEEAENKRGHQNSPREKLKKGISALIWTAALVAFFVLSFKNHAWVISWLVFPIAGCMQGLVSAIIDLMEENNHEA